MDPQNQAGAPQAVGITIGEIKTICAQAALHAPTRASGYRPTQPQIFFFTLVWLSKTALRQRETIQFEHKAALIRCVDAATVRQRAQLVTQFLEEWGAAVTSLKQREDKRWELLRIQMEKAAKRFDCPTEIKDEAVQDALMKLLQVLKKIPDSALLDTETQTALVELVLKDPLAFKGIYDFGAPLYAYAQRIVHNRCVDLLDKPKHASSDDEAWDEAIDAPMGGIEPDTDETEAYPQRLKKSLNRLFFLIQTELTPMPQKVIWCTLAARSQFWLALAITEFTAPVALQPTPGATDVDSAQTLEISENNLCVHRNHAKKTIYKIDQEAGKLLEVLLDRHLAKQLNDWPKI